LSFFTAGEPKVLSRLKYNAGFGWIVTPLAWQPTSEKKFIMSLPISSNAVARHHLERETIVCSWATLGT
jgi:hypothetical protein